MAAAGIGERRKLPHAVVDESKSGRGSVRMGGGELQTDRERESAGGSWIRRRSWETYNAAVSASGAPRRSERCGGCAGNVPSQSRCVHPRSLENLARRGF